MKLLLKLIVVVIVLLVVAAVGFGYYVDSIARRAIERGGSLALGVETTLESADVGILGGTFEMSGLRVANVDGFERDHFLALGSGGVSLDLGSLRRELIELPSLELRDIDLSLERREGRANYDVILENLKRLGPGTEPDPDAEAGKMFVVRELAIHDVNVHIETLPAGGRLTALEVPIERITLRNVGSGGDALPLAKLAGVIVQAILQAIVEQGGGVLPADLLGDLRGRLAGLESLESLGISSIAELGDVAEKLGEAGEALGEVGEKLKGAGDELKKGLGDLLGGDGG